MPLFGNVSIRISEIKKFTFDASSVTVSPRPYHALALRICGKATFTHGNNIISTSKGDVFFLPANCSYKVDYLGCNEIIVIHFYSEPVPEPENFRPHSPDAMRELFQKALDIWQSRSDSYYFSAMAAVCEILSVLSAEKSRSYPEPTYGSFRLAVEYMENNYTKESLTVDKVISISYMSGTYFRKIFLEKMGTTPIKYLNFLRLGHAKKLLASGKYSVAEAASLSGFSDAKYFSRLVKKEYGVPPSMLYRHIKQKNGM